MDNLSLQEAIERIICMAKMRDGKSRLVFSLNEKILFNTPGYPFSRPRHPELLNVLRTSELVMANDFPIVWLSQIMGRPLQQRLPAADLAPLLAQRSAEEGLSLFLLGGTEVVSAAAESLKVLCPTLNIAGTCAYLMSNEVETATELAAKDARVLHTINNTIRVRTFY